MRLPARLAFRYIVKRRSGTLVHVISGISVLVIAAVTTAMVAILSAFNGIEDLVSSLFESGAAHRATGLASEQPLACQQHWAGHAGHAGNLAPVFLHHLRACFSSLIGLDMEGI